MGTAGTIVAHEILVRALDARGYDTRGGDWLGGALERFLAENGYPNEVRQLRDRSVLFTGAAEGAAEVLAGSAWFTGTHMPRTGAPADAPPPPLVRAALGALAISTDARRRIAIGATIGLGGAILVGFAIAAARRST